MKMRRVVHLMVVAMLGSAGTAAMAAGDVAGVNGIDSSTSSAPTGSSTTLGGGGSSFAAPAGTDGGPGLVTGLAALARTGSPPATGVVVPEIRPADANKASEVGPPPDLGLPAQRSGN